MIMENRCPECDKDLDWDAGLYKCSDCGVKYKKVAFCPACDAELEKLQACGAVSYFCNNCNEPKSKSAVRVEFQKESDQ